MRAEQLSAPDTSLNVSAYDLHTRLRSPIICSMMRAQGGERILDLGSGLGYFAEKISACASMTVCVDICSDNLLTIQKRRAVPLVLLHASAEAMPFKDASFDKVLCSEVIEHIQNENAVLDEIARVIMPGGILVLTVPCSECKFPSLIKMLQVKTVHDYDGPEKHYRSGYDLDGLIKMLARKGMAPEQHVYFAHFFSNVLLDLISLTHRAFRRFVLRQHSWNWTDIQLLNTSLAFRIYRSLFPCMLLICKLDWLFLWSGRARGSGIALRLKKNAQSLQGQHK